MIANVPFCVRGSGDEERSRRAIELSASMFLRIRENLNNVEATFTSGDNVVRQLSATSRWWKEKWAAGMRPLFDTFEKQMME